MNSCEREVIDRAPNQLFINGKFVDSKSGKCYESYDPRTNEVLTKVARATPEDVDKAVCAARGAFDEGPWPRMKAKERGMVLCHLATMMEEEQEYLTQLECLDSGKTYAQVSHSDVPEAIYHFRYFAGMVDKIEGRTVPVGGAGVNGNDFTAYTLKEPIGVVAQIVPWNFPLLMATWKLAPALACGNCVVLKASQHTALSALYLAKLASKAGVPPGVLNVITGKGSEVGDALTTHPKVDKVAFTGSTEVGKKTGAKAMESTAKNVTLELGGNAPVLVAPSANMDEAVKGVVAGCIFNAGQACEAGARVYVHRSIYEKFSRGVADLMARKKVGDSMDPDTEVGPLVSQEQFDKVTDYIERGKKAGARVLAGGGAWEGWKDYKEGKRVGRTSEKGMPTPPCRQQRARGRCGGEENEGENEPRSREQGRKEREKEGQEAPPTPKTGKALSKGFFVQPTVFGNVTDDMDISRDEIFGPVMTLSPYDSLEEVIPRMNDTEYGLAAAVWANDLDTVGAVTRNVKAGTVWVNTHHLLDAATPFGGFKQSGVGREHGFDGLEYYTQTKTVVMPLPKLNNWTIM